ncbi:hypothetical protein TSAR_002459 [Trichomalopsis sarcophagae]|uniref:Uncharacterized protein n=1 Tax=Trichomalopsis sarcophagae TaxID=543379 RepID=A0A232FIV9_9HYME|nr:hypothetical protein TSAR_002459 [Trichomalopsis sarcophagae]
MPSSGKSTSVRCPKCCPKQCENCPSPAVVPQDIPHEQMDEIIQSAYAEKAVAVVPRGRPSERSSQMNRYCSRNTVNGSDDSKIPLTWPIAIKILKNWCRDTSFDIEDALYDVKCIWNSRDEGLLEKLCSTNRLLIYYLLVLALYIIHICFLIDQQLIDVFFNIVSSKTNES